MSDIKVSEMTEATEVNDDDLLMIVQNDISKKAKASEVRLKTAILNQNIHVNQNQEVTLNVDYSSINGTIIASVFIGCICTLSSVSGITKAVPIVTGTGTSANKVTSIQLNSHTTQDIYASILVFYK